MKAPDLGNWQIARNLPRRRFQHRGRIIRRPHLRDYYFLCARGDLCASAQKKAEQSTGGRARLDPRTKPRSHGERSVIEGHARGTIKSSSGVRAIAPGPHYISYGSRPPVPSDNKGARHPCRAGNSAFPQVIHWPSPESFPLMGNSPAGVKQRVLSCQDSTAAWISTTPISRPPSSLPRNTSRFGYVLRLQSAVAQVSTSTISIACADLRTSYELNALRHRAAKSGRVAKGVSLPLRACASRSACSRSRWACSARRLPLTS